MGKINFIYEKRNWESIIWNISAWKITNKQYYFGNLFDLDFDNEIYLYLLDTHFSYFQKDFIYNDKKKITLNEIEKNLKEFNLWKNKIIWYNISNILVNWSKSNTLLWHKWEIIYTIWIYTLNEKYNCII